MTTVDAVMQCLQVCFSHVFYSTAFLLDKVDDDLHVRGFSCLFVENHGNGHGLVTLADGNG